MRDTSVNAKNFSDDALERVVRVERLAHGLEASEDLLVQERLRSLVDLTSVLRPVRARVRELLEEGRGEVGVEWLVIADARVRQVRRPVEHDRALQSNSQLRVEQGTTLH